MARKGDVSLMNDTNWVNHTLPEKPVVFKRERIRVD